MNRYAFTILVSTVLALILLPTPADAARKTDPDAAGELYGDLFELERDGNGEPILRQITYLDPETGQEVTVDCPQPLAFDCAATGLVDCALIPLKGEKLDFDPEEEDACEPQELYADCLREISFGRGSVARAQDFVIDSSYAEFIKTINTASDLTLDPARRVRLLVPTETDPAVEIWHTIDAPLQNLGLYREIMTNGCLGTVVDEVVGEGGQTTLVTWALEPGALDLLCPGFSGLGFCLDPDAAPLSDLLCAYPDYDLGEWWMTPQTGDDLTSEDLSAAAAFMATATDKGNPLGLGEIININTYLGINSYTWVKVKKNRVLTVDYFEFLDPVGPAGWFAYDRDTRFPADTEATLLVHTDGNPVDYPHSLLAQAQVLLFDDLDGEPDDGTPFVDLTGVDLPICRSGQVYPSAQSPLVCDSPTAEPYDPASDLWGCGGADWFVQAAEHSRKVVWFLHNWSVPEIEY